LFNQSRSGSDYGLNAKVLRDHCRAIAAGELAGGHVVLKKTDTGKAPQVVARFSMAEIAEQLRGFRRYSARSPHFWWLSETGYLQGVELSEVPITVGGDDGPV
jgi:hypothetical protein